ncbi:MAG: M20/M25/M40 family metallo-hydrolase [Acidobacteria bacterium]|nr:M20/M25/M40 family metallo-hydrolase [Acidobacteriota bacterium]
MKKTTTVLLLVFCLLAQSVAFVRAQTVPDQADVFARIRKEGMEKSQIMRTLHYFTDVYGPRLTGSPNHKAAADWAVAQMTTWGFDNAHLEPWDFGHPGWVNERASGFITAPVQDSLVFEVLSWTPGTKKAVRGQAVQLVIPTTPAPTDQNPNAVLQPTQAELTAYFEKIKPQIRGNMILVGKPAVIPVNITPPPKRLSDDDLKRRFDPKNPGPQFNFPGPPAPVPGHLTPQQVSEQLDQFLVDNKAAVRVNDAGREHGQIRAFNNRSFDLTKNVPTVVLRNEDFGRIARLLADGTAVSLEFDIRNKVFPEGTTSYNTIGELTGTDKKDEVIMLGGHLDSWHAATGATDNAIGCAIMMEAARILKTIGVKPRRTVRVALWSGEEQGLLGSQAYVKEHFGSFEDPKPGYEKFGGYFNIDSGTGRARGMSVFGPPEAADILREALAPYADFGFIGVINGRSRNLGGSDNTSFSQAGLPGIGVQQDPIEYGTHTWHTNLDTYERVIEDDVKKSAVIIASAVYVLAMRDELLPRYTKEAMPPLPQTSPTPAPSPTPAGKKK